MHGTIMYLPTRKPTEHELQECDRYELTLSISWEPSSIGIEPHDISELTFECNPLELMEDFASRIVSSLHGRSGLKARDRDHHEADVIAHARGITRESFSLGQGTKRTAITADDLAARWYIGKEMAARTLNATTQEGMRFVDGPLERHLKTSQAHLRFPTLYTRMYSDTLFRGTKSVRGFTCAQLFTDGHGFSRIYQMRSKADAYHALMQFIHEAGVPKDLLTDGALEEMHGEWGCIV
jgi:hypothetical protein